MRAPGRAAGGGSGRSPSPGSGGGSGSRGTGRPRWCRGGCWSWPSGRCWPSSACGCCSPRPPTSSSPTPSTCASWPGCCCCSRPRRGPSCSPLSPARRQHVLPLSFTRPVTRSDYLLAKLAALLAVMGLIAIVPLVVLFCGNTLTADSAATYLGDHLDDLGKILIAGSVLTVFYSVTALAAA